MTDAERKIAKLSRTLNNASLYPQSYFKTTEDAYINTIHQLNSSLQSEKTKNKEQQTTYNLSIQAKLKEDSLKDLACKHHSKVLQAQIEENRLKKQILKEPTDFTPYSILSQLKPEKNFKLKEDLIAQITEKQLVKKEQRCKDIEYQQKLIDESNKKLLEEYDTRAQAKESAYQSMVESWEQSAKLKGLAKELEKMRLYGPKPTPKPVVIQEIDFDEPITVQESPKTGKNKRYKSVEKSFNWKSTLRTSSVQASETSHSKRSYNGVIEKFGKLNAEEKNIKIDKEKLLKYFKQKQKKKENDRKKGNEGSKVPVLPKIGKS